MLVPERAGSRPSSAAGRLFIQSWVALRDGKIIRLDDAIGYRFAIVAWAADPGTYMSTEARNIWSRLGGRTLVVRSSGEIGHDADDIGPNAVMVGDTSMALNDWLAAEDTSVVVLRPDSIVAGACRPQEISSAIVELGKVTRLTPESPLAARIDCSTPS